MSNYVGEKGEEMERKTGSFYRYTIAALVICMLYIVMDIYRLYVNGDKTVVVPKSEKTVLTIWKWSPTEDQSQMPAIKKAFEAENPDISLDINHIEGVEQYFQKLPSALLSNNGPDIIEMQVGGVLNQYKDYLEPLEPYAKKTWGENWQGMFIPEALRQCEFSGREYYALPGGMTVEPIIVYNAGLFEKYNLSPPRTTSDLKEIINVLKKNEPDILPGLAVGGADKWPYRDIFMAIANQVSQGRIYMAEEGKIPWNDAAIIRGFDLWKKLYNDNIFINNSSVYSSYPQIENMFVNGEVAMFSTGSWEWGTLTSDESTMNRSKFKWGVIPFPAVEKGLNSEVLSTVDVGWAMNSKINASKREAAWKFIKFMTAGNGQKIWTRSMQIYSADSSTGLDLGSIGNSEDKKDIAATYNYLNNSAGNREFRTIQVRDAIDDKIEEIISMNKTGKQICDELQHMLTNEK